MYEQKNVFLNTVYQGRKTVISCYSLTLQEQNLGIKEYKKFKIRKKNVSCTGRRGLLSLEDTP